MPGIAEHVFDVAILGSGMSGSILGAILARQGKRVLILDSKAHPRFAVGESTIPHTSLLLSLLSQRYDVPELHNLGLASPMGIRNAIGPSCGIKRTFAFAYHAAGCEHDPREAVQFGNVYRDENHLFRQDVDAYLLRLAIRYGATAIQTAKVASLQITEGAAGGVKLELQRGEQFEARYLVDGTGHDSVLARNLGLLEEPTRLAHHSRSLFTHMIDVLPFEQSVSNLLSIPWSHGTLHHVFDRGWIWVIPFNNSPWSTNPLVSVGLTIDPRRYPPGDLPPEEEFAQFVARFPSVARQFASAKAVRPWVSTGRLQYSSTRTLGHRFCLMSHAAGFVDPLYSRGLINTLEGVYGLVEPLLAALREDDFAVERFAALERTQQKVLDYADRVVNGSFISWSDFALWNAWFRCWAVGTASAEATLANAIADFTNSGDAAFLQGDVDEPVFSAFEDPGYAAFFDLAAQQVESFERGEIPSSCAAARIFAMLSEHDCRMFRDGVVSGGLKWALTHPACRDLHVGLPHLQRRWHARQPDPHLGAPAPVAPSAPVAAAWLSGAAAAVQ